MIICCENPCAFLFYPGTDRLAVAFSFWQVSFSDFGVGKVLFSIDCNDDRLAFHCFHNNAILAREIHTRINRHFEIFRNYQSSGIEFIPSNLQSRTDGVSQYAISVKSADQNVALKLSRFRPAVQTSVTVKEFGKDGKTSYKVYATIVEAEKVTLVRNGQLENFAIIDKYSSFNSSAFLSLGESWASI